MKLLKPFLLILICIISLSFKKTIRIESKVTRSEEIQKVYRCCQGKCYLLKSYTEQDIIIKEIYYREVDHSNNPLILSSRYCPKSE